MYCKLIRYGQLAVVNKVWRETSSSSLKGSLSTRLLTLLSEGGGGALALCGGRDLNVG